MPGLTVRTAGRVACVALSCLIAAQCLTFRPKAALRWCGGRRTPRPTAPTREVAMPARADRPIVNWTRRGTAIGTAPPGRSAGDATGARPRHLVACKTGSVSSTPVTRTRKTQTRCGVQQTLLSHSQCQRANAANRRRFVSQADRGTPQAADGPRRRSSTGRVVGRPPASTILSSRSGVSPGVGGGSNVRCSN